MGGEGRGYVPGQTLFSVSDPHCAGDPAGGHGSVCHGTHQMMSHHRLIDRLSPKSLEGGND